MIPGVDVAPSELDGVPQDYIDSHKPGSDGKVHITNNYPDLFPVLTFAKSDRVRRSLYEPRLSEEQRRADGNDEVPLRACAVARLCDASIGCAGRFFSLERSL